MCGRYGRWSDPEWLVEEFSDLQLPAIPFPPTYNAAPQSQQPVLRLNPHTGQPELVPMRWGLIPFWAGPGAFNRLTFNARAEELSQNRPSVMRSSRAAASSPPMSSTNGAGRKNKSSPLRLRSPINGPLHLPDCGINGKPKMELPSKASQSRRRSQIQ